MKNTIRKPSPNFATRAPGSSVKFLILHYTACDLDLALKILTDGKSQNRVSSHYVIGEKGEIFYLVDEQYSAWHAGVSSWKDYEKINTWSVGIELVNPGHELGYRAFPQAQMTALIDLSLQIQARHNIPAHHVLGHADIAPTRKRDPGELLDWKGLAALGLGCHVEVSDHPPQQTDIPYIQGLLKHIGYGITLTGQQDPQTLDALRAFCMRCAPAFLKRLTAPQVIATLESYVDALGQKNRL